MRQPLKTNASENRHEKSISKEMLLTVAYDKNKSTSNALDYNSPVSNGNESIHGKNLLTNASYKKKKKIKRAPITRRNK